MNEPDISKFFYQINHLFTVRDCSILFHRAIKTFGFDVFVCGDIDIARRSRAVFYALNWPQEWQEYYLSSQLQDHDPILDALAHRREPFTWSELRKDRTLPKVGTEALRLAAERGWVEGLVIPFTRGRTHYGLVSLSGREGGMAKSTRQFLTMAGTIFYHKVRLLAPLTGFTISPFGLTPRELDCLRELCNGLPDRQIAAALNISMATAHEYVEAAKRKLQSRTRAQAVAIAIRFGLVAL